MTTEKIPLASKKGDILPTCYVENVVDAPEKVVPLLTEMARQNEDRIEQILCAQKLCLSCNGKDCTQEIPEMVPIVRGFMGHYSMALMECPQKEIKLQKCREAKQFAAAHLPKIFAEKRFRDFKGSPENERALSKAWELVRSPKGSGGLYLHGPSGTGKTFLVSLIGRGLLLQNVPVRFTSCGDFLETLRQSLHGAMKEEFAKVAHSPVLILDDLGAEQPTSWGLEQLFRLLDTRYKENLRTLITSNWTLPALKARWSRTTDATTASRLISRIERLCFVVGMDEAVPEDLFA